MVFLCSECFCLVRFLHVEFCLSISDKLEKSCPHAGHPSFLASPAECLHGLTGSEDCVCSAHRSRDGVDGEGKEGIAKQLFSSNLFNFLRTHMCLTTTYLRGLALEKRSLQHGLVFSCLLVGKSRILTGARWEWLLGSSIQPQQHSQLSIVHEMESRASCYRCSDCILHGL